jgi:uncharacterized protein YcnI
MRRVLATTAVVVLTLGVSATAALAHAELSPETAEPGSTVAFDLSVENEQTDAATTKVELTFPEPITVVELPDAPGFTAAVVDGAIGGPASGVTWEGTVEGDVEVALTLGPLPAEAGRLQFKVVHTYDNGEIDRWIEDWPEGEPEPESPGPVVDLVSGEATETTAAETDTETTVDEHSTETTAAPATTAAAAETADDADDDDDSNTTILLVVLLAAVALGGAGTLVMMRRRNRPQP